MIFVSWLPTQVCCHVGCRVSLSEAFLSNYQVIKVNCPIKPHGWTMLLLACPTQPSSSCVLDLLGRGKGLPRVPFGSLLCVSDNWWPGYGLLLARLRSASQTRSLKQWIWAEKFLLYLSGGGKKEVKALQSYPPTLNCFLDTLKNVSE